MEKKFLEQFERKTVKLILKNNFIYSKITFHFNRDMIEFEDRTGEKIIIDPYFVAMISVEEEK